MVARAEPAGAGETVPQGEHRPDMPARGPAFTDTWRHTTDGMDVAGMMITLQKSLSHPGYGTRASGMEPPTVRMGCLVACDPLDESPSASELRSAFCGFLDRPPVRSLVTQLTSVPNDLSWSNYDGNGRLMVGAVLSAENDERSAPIASAILNLKDNEVTRWQHAPRRAELVLVVEPRDGAGEPAPPAILERWHERLVATLEVPGAFARFLTDEVGVETHADPPVEVGVCLEAQPNIGALVDTGPLKRLPGSPATSHFPSYVIALRDGRRPERAAVDMLRAWCDYGLRVDGYEDLLAALG
jgi:hypothetical protein